MVVRGKEDWLLGVWKIVCKWSGRLVVMCLEVWLLGVSKIGWYGQEDWLLGFRKIGFKESRRLVARGQEDWFLTISLCLSLKCLRKMFLKQWTVSVGAWGL